MISSFTGRYRFLSNFAAGWPFPYRGHEWLTAEHAFQACKATSLFDFQEVKAAKTPTLAKQIGRHIEVRPDWEQVKKKIMLEVVLSKFDFSPILQQLLAGTGTEILVEGNTWGDTYWGMVRDGETWAGENHLGQILMMVREVLT